MGVLCFGVESVDELLMSLAVGAASSSNNMGLEENKEAGEKSGVVVGEKSAHPIPHDNKDETGEKTGKCVSETDEDDDEERENIIQLGPQYTLKEQIEKDKVCFVFAAVGTQPKKRHKLFIFVLLNIIVNFLCTILLMSFLS